jgi:hypothetical protein
MKKFSVIIVALLVVLTVVFSGCEKKAEAPKVTPQPAVAPAAPAPAPSSEQPPAAAPAPAPAPAKPAKK